MKKIIFLLLIGLFVAGCKKKTIDPSTTEKKDYVLDVPKRDIQNVPNVILDNELKERISIYWGMHLTPVHTPDIFFK